MSYGTCAADDCQRAVGPESDHPDFCSPLCQTIWARGDLDLMPYRPKGTRGPEMKSLEEVASRKMTRLDAAFDWLDARLRSAP